jgi:hypothetical protein
VPFEIDRTVRRFAMDFGPAVRATWPLVFRGNQIKSSELRISHYLFPQRSASGGDNLNHRLHYTPTFSRKSVLLQSCFTGSGDLKSRSDLEIAPLEMTQTRLSASRDQRAIHHINIDVSFIGMMKSTRQRANDFKSEVLP